MGTGKPTKVEKCGVYEIRCIVSGKCYVGSSKRIYRRWHEHRRHLRKGVHSSPRLQQAWNKHGELNFKFSVLEECQPEDVFAREQAHIDRLTPDYNSMPQVRVITPEMRQKMNAAAIARSAARTHCPNGHKYTEDNVYLGKKIGDKRCKTCNRERVHAAFCAETPEQRAERRARTKAYYEQNRDERLAKQREYTLKTKDAKRAYDIAYREIKNARRREATRAKRAGGEA